MKKNYLSILLILTVCLTSFAQDWVRYSDSILSNIRSSNYSNAETFLVLAEQEMSKRNIVEDTLYADFLYRRAMLKKAQNKNPKNDFVESIDIWNQEPNPNNKKLLRLYYFFGEYYDFIAKNYKDAYKYYELCYKTGLLIDFDSIDIFKDITYRLYLIDRWENKNETRSKIWASIYIDLKKHLAFEVFDTNFSRASGYVNGEEEEIKILKEYLKLYEERNITNLLLLINIYFDVMNSNYSLGNYSHVINFGEKLLKEDDSYFSKSDKKLIYTLLISAYHEIGDNINEVKYIKLKSVQFPKEESEIDYYDNLELLIIDEDYDKFNSLFKEYESQLIIEKDFNSLIMIYMQSLTLFERGIIFKKEDIEKQKLIIEQNRNSLSDENKSYLDLFIAEYSFYVQDFTRTLQIAARYVDFEDDTIKLTMYRLRAVSEMTLGIENGGKTANKALEIARDIYGENSPQILTYLNLVLALNNKGNNNQTIELATKAMEIIYNNGLENTDIAAEVWSSLALEATFKENYIDGETYYKNAIRIYESYKKINNIYNYYSGLLGLSAIYIRLGKFDESLKYLNNTKTFLDSTSNKMDLVYGDYYYYLGDYYFWQDKFQEAKENYEKALGIYGSTMSKGRDLHLILSNYFLNNNVDVTIKKLETYLDNNGNIGNISKLIYLLKFNTNLTEESRNVLTNSIDKVITDNNEYFHLLSDEEKETVYKNFTDQFEFLNSHLLFTNDQSFLEKYINYRFYYKSLLFYNSSTNYAQNEESRTYLNQFKANNILINKYYEKQDGNNYLNEINELKQKNRELEKFLSQEKSVIDMPSINQIKNKLSDKSAYVEIIRINKQSRSATKDKLNIINKFTDSIYYGAVIIKKHKDPKFILISKSKNFEEDYLKDYNNYIYGSNKFDIDKNSYSLFFEDIENELSGVESIYFVSDGIYNSINPEVFFNQNKNKYVLEYLDIHRIISARSLLNKGADYSKNNLTAILIGNPEFELEETSISANGNNILISDEVSYLRDYKDSKQIGYLPGTEKEIHSIEDILKKANFKVDLFSSTQASEENLKTIMSPKILHIATHGYFLRIKEETDFKNSLMGMQSNYLQSNVYLKSGLLLAGAQNTVNGNKSSIETDNGIFSAFEAKNLDLKNTDLVVLSACETGLGDNLVGEGVYGLQRAFMIAGAKSLIMSLWKVDDATTQKLMELFYSNWIEKGLRKAEAFKLAKIELKKEYPQPFYWAPFILIE